MDADVDQWETASQANHGSTQNVHDCRHSGFDLGTGDVNRYLCEDGNDAVTDEEEDASQADDESMQNVEDWGHSAFDLGTSDVNRYECEDGADADTDEEEEASQADDGSMHNVENRGHSTRECENWTVYIRHVKFDNGEANATASNDFQAKTVLQSFAKSQSWIY